MAGAGVVAEAEAPGEAGSAAVVSIGVVSSEVISSSSSLSMTVASDSCDLKKYSFCCLRLLRSLDRGQAFDSSPQSSESYSESEAFSLSESDISTATRRAKMEATSV